MKKLLTLIGTVSIVGSGTSIMTSCSENNTNNKIAFKNYTTKNGLGSNYVTGVSVSSDGNTIYAATYGGVSIGTKSNDNWTFKIIQRKMD